MARRRSSAKIAIDAEGRLSEEKTDLIEGVFAEAPQQDPVDLRAKRKAAFKIADAARSAMIRGPIPYYLDDAIQERLIRLIRQCRLDYGLALAVFWHLEIILNADLGTMSDDDPRKEYLADALRTLKDIAVEYFEEELGKEFKEMNIADILVQCEERLDHMCETRTVFGQALLNVLNSTKKKIDRQRKKAEIQEALKSDFDYPKRQLDAGLNEEESEGAKLLASNCALFANASLETRQTAWKLLQRFTRKQWANFFDRANIDKSATKTERAELASAISGKTSFRDLFGRQPTALDKTQVSKVITLLNADRIKTQNA